VGKDAPPLAQALSARICRAKDWILGLVLFQSLADRRMNRSAASPENRESIDFLRSSGSMDFSVLLVITLTCSMSALESLSGSLGKGLASGLAFGSVLAFCSPWSLEYLQDDLLAFSVRLG
jgi:hypothetical protein